MAKLDPSKGWRAVEGRLKQTSEPRQRLLLENLRDHLLAEATSNFDLLLGTLAEDPQYCFWVDGSGFGAGPRGLAAVTAHYETLYEENRHVCEYDIERIVADDDTIVTEGWFRQVFPGRVLISRGADIDDPAAVYLLTMRLVLFWPYDEAGKLIGEDSYSDGRMYSSDRIEKLAPEDIPAEYYRRVEP